ncbi:putative Ig domain-containing protein, partial [Rhizobium sp. CFBP 13717]|nr:putative Ig domain-containing protein [Rhizobium sp. CFBP 13717]
MADGRKLQRFVIMSARTKIVFSGLAGTFQKSLPIISRALLVAATVFLPGQALAVSAACQAITDDFGDGRTFPDEGSDSGQDSLDYVAIHKAFAADEVIRWRAISTGVAKIAGYSSSFEIVINGIPGQRSKGSQGQNDTQEGNFDLSGSHTIAAGDGFVINYGVSNSAAHEGNSLYLRARCVSNYTIGMTPPASSFAAKVGQVFSKTIAAAKGVEPYIYTVSAGALPAGLSLDSASGVLSGTPTAGGNFSFSITATDHNYAATAVAYTMAVADTLRANAVPATVPANSSANVITLNITGGAAASVAIDSQASHGTATASGTSITYTPTAGYSGS